MATALVNRVPFDFQSVETEIVANGTSLGLVEGLEEFDYTVTINRTEMYGRSRLPIDVTEGDAEFAASITISRDWWHFVRDGAREAGIALASLEMVIAFTFYHPDVNGAPLLVTDTLTGVRVNEIGNSGSHGPDVLMVSMPLRVGNIYFSGQDVFGNSL